MTLGVVGRPPATPSRRGGDATSAQADHCRWRLLLWTLDDGNVPAVPIRRSATDRKVTADLDQDTISSSCEQLFDHDVGRETFADSSGVDCRAHRQLHDSGRSIDADLGGAPLELDLRANLGVSLRVCPARSIARFDNRSKKGRVIRTVGEVPCFDHRFDQSCRVGGHDHRDAPGAIQSAHFAVGEKPAPSSFELMEPLDG